MRGITIAEIEQLTGASRFQIMRWVKSRLLPQPTIERGATGRGRQALWPRDVLGLVETIVEQSGRGVPLARIAAHLRAASQGEQSDLDAIRAGRETLERWRVPGSAGL